MLEACRELFEGHSFISTENLLNKLKEREEDPWSRWDHGEGMSAYGLSRLLNPFGIASNRDKAGKKRGYYAASFEEAWSRYLPPLARGEIAEMPVSNPKKTVKSVKPANPVKGD